MGKWTLLALCFVLGLAISWFLLSRVIKMAYSHKYFDKQNSRKIHHGNIPRLGGVTFFPTMLLATFLTIFVDYMTDGPLLQLFGDNIVKASGVVGAGLVMYTFGLVDDMKDLRYLVKFGSQIVAALILCFTGTYIDNLHGALGLQELPTSTGYLVTVFAFMFVVNAINFIDGIDGLAASLCLLALAYFMILFPWGTEEASSLFIVSALALSASVVVFLCYNLGGSEARKNKIFMGDTGSTFLGMMLTVMGIAITRLQAVPQASLMPGANALVLGFAPLTLPCYDVFRVVFHRIRFKKSPFAPDTNHVHHKLMHLGMSQHATLATIIVLSITLIFIMVLLSMVMNINLVLAVSLCVWLLFNLALTKKIEKNQQTTI